MTGVGFSPFGYIQKRLPQRHYRATVALATQKQAAKRWSTSKASWLALWPLFATTIVHVVILISVLVRLSPTSSCCEVSFDLRSILNRPSFWLIPLVAFALAFYWEFRRASR
jgi:hypothetical protein